MSKKNTTDKDVQDKEVKDPEKLRQEEAEKEAKTVEEGQLAPEATPPHLGQ